MEYSSISGRKETLKKYFTHPWLVLFVRLLLGGLFIIASLDKIADPLAFDRSILNYKVIEEPLAMAVATVLPWLELLCGLGLIAGILHRGSALLISFLIVVFTALVISALIRGLDISCGCFSQDPQASKIGIQKVIENTGMFLLSIYTLATISIEVGSRSIFNKTKNELPSS